MPTDTSSSAKPPDTSSSANPPRRIALKELHKDDLLQNLDELQIDDEVSKGKKIAEINGAKRKKRTDSMGSYISNTRDVNKYSCSSINQTQSNYKSAMNKNVKDSIVVKSNVSSNIEHKQKTSEIPTPNHPRSSQMERLQSHSTDLKTSCNDDDRGHVKKTSHKPLIRNVIPRQEKQRRPETLCSEESMNDSVRSMSMSPQVIRTRTAAKDKTTIAADNNTPQYSSQQTLNTWNNHPNSNDDNDKGSQRSLDQLEGDQSSTMMAISQDFWKRVESKAAGLFSAMSRKKE